MIIHNVEQGSREWQKLRIGIPTASNFDKIVTPSKGEFSKSCRPYMFKLIAEIMLNQSLDNLEFIEHVQRGKELEPEAALAYEFQNEVKTEKVGLVTTDDLAIGASPDRFVGNDGLVEIKVPAPNTHVGYMVDGFGDDYKCQVQGQLWVTGRQWCDRFSYSPDMPPVQQRTYRDEEFIQKLAAAVNEFCNMKLRTIAELEKRGLFFRRAEFMAPEDVAYEAVSDEMASF